MATPSANLSTPPDGIWDSLSKDQVSAAGLQNVTVDVDADATVQTESNSSSSASADNVTGDSGAGSTTTFNAGLQGSSSFDVEADAGIQGLAGTTAASSASTSKGVAKAFTELGDSAGVKEVTSLEVGGELSALGQSINSLSADAESVVGKAVGRSKMTDQVEGLEANDISVSSDAGIQGLAQLSNAASAATTDGDALSTAAAEKLQGADLEGLDVGGVASVIGQTTLSNTASSETVVGDDKGAKATASLKQADGLRASNDSLPDAGAGIEVSSDATLTGLASIDNAASAAATSGASTATATAGSVDGARINSTDIGGVGSITGQTNFAGSADAANVTDGNSTATATLTNADGLQGKDLIKVSSDAGLTGLNAVDLTASAASTGSATLETIATSTAEATTLQGAQLSNNTDIGGVGTIGGQVDFNGSAASSNVTGNADATGSLASLAQGLSTGIDTHTSEFGTAISSDGTVQGFANTSLTASAGTTQGGADANATGADIDGAVLGDLSIGGVGTVTGSANFAASADAANVTAGELSEGNLSTADAWAASVDGLDLLADSNGLKVSSDAGIQGLASIDLAATAASTGALDAKTQALATASADELQGAELNSLTDIGGVGSIAGQVSLGSAADAANVTGKAQGIGTLRTAEGLDLNANLEVASDANVSGSATIGSTADAATTNGKAIAKSTSEIITGADLSEGLVDIGGIGSIAGQANFDLSASSSNVEGKLSKAVSSADTSTGLIGKETTNPEGTFGIDVASDSGLSGMAIGSLTADASSTAGIATAIAGKGDEAIGAQLPSLNVGGISDLTGAAQLDSSATASNVGADTFDATALAGQDQSVIGLTTGLGGTFDSPSPAAPGTENGVLAPNFGAFNIDVASDSNITAQGFNNLDASASSTAGDAVAAAGYTSAADASVTGIASGMSIDVGGVSNLMAQAQGTADSSASSVTGLAQSDSGMDAMGIEALQMNVSSDSDLSSTSAVIGSADGESTSGAATADIDFEAIGIDGIAMNVGGIGTLASTASVNGSSDATNVGAAADGIGMVGDLGSTATGDLDAVGLNSAHLFSSSDGDVSGIATIDSSINAESTAGDGFADADFDAIGALNLEMGAGGLFDLAGQAQVNADVSASSVSGNAEAFSGVTDNSTIKGLTAIEADGASDGTILGTAFGDFSTSAESTGADATANAAQSLTGIDSANTDFGGVGSISAIAQDSNFVEASSVSGNASATASVDAIGLDGGTITIASDAVLTSSVSVDSAADSSTVGVAPMAV